MHGFYIEDVLILSIIENWKISSYVAHCLQEDKEQRKWAHTPCSRKAPAVTKLNQEKTAALTEIPADELPITTTHYLGEGSVGKCTVVIYKQCYDVCVKSMNTDLVDKSRLLQEARILTILSGH